MSVKVVDRNESKVQYVTTAVELQKKTIFVLTRMSNKMQGFFKDDLMWLASSITNGCAKAQSIYPSTKERALIREQYVLEAKSSVDALDIQLGLCFDFIKDYPEYAFSTRDDEPIEASKAREKLNKLMKTTGDLINQEKLLLDGVIKDNNKYISKYN